MLWASPFLEVVYRCDWIVHRSVTPAGRTSYEENSLARIATTASKRPPTIAASAVTANATVPGRTTNGKGD